MKAPKKDKHFIHKPSYPGGSKALWAFIRTNLRYPVEAQKAQISGIVRLKYTINGKGIVTSTKIIHSLGYGCDEEAERVIKMLKYHVPKHRKLKVKFQRSINIKFKAPPKKAIKVTLSKSKSGYKEQEEPREKGGYEYTITIK